MQMDLDANTIIVIIGTISGGVGLPIVNHLLSRRKVKIDDAAVIRKELREEVLTQRKEIDELEKQVTEWREKYFALRQEFNSIKAELDYALRTIKAEANRAQQVLPEDGP